VEIGPEDTEIIMPRYRPVTSNIGLLAADLGTFQAVKNDTITSDMSFTDNGLNGPNGNSLNKSGRASDMSLNSSIGSKASSNYWNGTINSVSNIRGNDAFANIQE
jgi:hypothetical protein